MAKKYRVKRHQLGKVAPTIPRSRPLALPTPRPGVPVALDDLRTPHTKKRGH